MVALHAIIWSKVDVWVKTTTKTATAISKQRKKKKKKTSLRTVPKKMSVKQ